MSVDLSIPRGDIFVIVDIVPASSERRPENIASLRISTVDDSSGGGFLVEGFDAGSATGSAIRTARIGPHGRNQPVWLLIANAAYALNAAKSDEI